MPSSAIPLSQEKAACVGQGAAIASHPGHPSLAMAECDFDEVVLEIPATRRSGRPSIETLLHRPGPAILVAVVASADARWAAELRASNEEAKALRELLQQRLHTGKPLSGQPRTVLGSSALLLW